MCRLLLGRHRRISCRDAARVCRPSATTAGATSIFSTSPRKRAGAVPFRRARYIDSARSGATPSRSTSRVPRSITYPTGHAFDRDVDPDSTTRPARSLRWSARSRSSTRICCRTCRAGTTRKCFQLDPRLVSPTRRRSANLRSRASLLMDDVRFPWLILVPRIAGARELIDLDAPIRPAARRNRRVGRALRSAVQAGQIQYRRAWQRRRTTSCACDRAFQRRCRVAASRSGAVASASLYGADARIAHRRDARGIASTRLDMSDRAAPDRPTRDRAARRTRLLLRFGDSLDAAVNAPRARGWSHELRAAHLPGIVDIVPAYATLGLHYDPGTWSRWDGFSPALQLTHAVQQISRAPPATLCIAPRRRDSGPLWRRVRSRSGGRREPRRTRRRGSRSRAHVAGIYRVAMLGFAPGFPYLLGLDPALTCPRRANPRTRVPAGSVAIGGAQTGIYPIRTSGRLADHRSHAGHAVRRSARPAGSADAGRHGPLRPDRCEVLDHRGRPRRRERCDVTSSPDC